MPRVDPPCEIQYLSDFRTGYPQCDFISMRRSMFIRKLIILTTVLCCIILAPSVVDAKPGSSRKQGVTAHRHGKKIKKNRTKRHRGTARRQTVAESLALLRKHLPEYEAAYETERTATQTSLDPLGEPGDSPFTEPSLRMALMRNLVSWLGIPYVHGGWSRRGVDCSGFTSCLLTETLGKKFWGDPRWQARQFPKITSMDSLRFGDLLFFSGRNHRSARIGHVAVYLGNGLFVHSSSRQGVIVTPLAKGYYTQRFRWAGRLDGKRYPLPEKHLMSRTEG